MELPDSLDEPLQRLQLDAGQQEDFHLEAAPGNSKSTH